MTSGNYGNVQGKPKHHEPSGLRSSTPRQAGPSHPRIINIKDVKDRLTPAHIEALCKAWLPDGKRQGGWWMAKAQWRNDNTPSLGVSLTTGHWKDFGGTESGDMIDLSMKLFGDSLRETIQGFAEMLGIAG